MKFGFFVKCPAIEIIESMGIAGLDFAVVDMEHTSLGPRDLYPLLLAAENRKLELIVRIPTKQDFYFKWCRDLNINVIQVPHVETADDVHFALKQTMFYPYGERGLCRFVRASDFSAKNKSEYLSYANSHNKLILQLEGKKAVDNIDEIISASKISPEISLFVGPYDLSQSLGKPGEIWDPLVQETMDMIISKCKDKNIAIGTFTDNIKGLEHWKKKGIDFVQYASDLNVFIDSAKHLKNLL